MSERVEYFVKCDRDMFAPTFTGMLAVWRAKRKRAALKPPHASRARRRMRAGPNWSHATAPRWPTQFRQVRSIPA